MATHDDILRDLLQQIARRRRLEAQRSTLCERQSQLRRSIIELEQKLHAEQADVQKLEGNSLAAFFYRVVGRLDEKLSKEREESYAAQVKYDAAVSELSAVNEALLHHDAQLKTLNDCYERYSRAKEDKLAALKVSHRITAGRILALEEELSRLYEYAKELKDAHRAAKNALSTARSLMQTLIKAGDMSFWDVAGAGRITTYAKHSLLDEAQNMADSLQIAMQRLNTELSDVKQQFSLNIKLNGFTRFADFFYDGILVDIAIHEHISASRTCVQIAGNHVAETIDRLTELLDTVNAEIKTKENELNELILNTPI